MNVKKVLSISLVSTMLIGNIPCADSYASEETWSDIYKEKLLETMESEDFNENFSFELYDLGTDNIPELIISFGDSSESKCRIYTYFNDEFIDLGEYGENGVIGYCPERQDILDCRHVKTPDDAEWESGTYYSLENGRSFTKIVSYSNTGYGIYQLNGRVSLYSDYKEVLSEFESKNFKWIGRANKLDENGIYNAFMGDWREIYQSYLNQKKDNEYINYEEYFFDLYDINDDGIPELFITDETGECEVYTAYNGSLDFLMSSDYGMIMLHPKKNQILTRGLRPNNMFMDVYSLNDGMLERTDHLASISGRFGSDYYINGESVSADEFNEMYYNSGNLRYVGRRYALNDLGIGNAFKPSETALTDKQKEIYARLIFSNMGLTGSYYMPGFDIYDIDGDGVPELIYNFAEHSEKIYKLNGDSAEEMAVINSRAVLGFDDENTYLMNKEERIDYSEGVYRKVSGGKISEVFQYSACASCGSHNDESEQNKMIYKLYYSEVTEEEYNAAVSEYENIEPAVVIGFRYRSNVYDVADIIFGEASFVNILKSMSSMIETFPIRIEEE